MALIRNRADLILAAAMHDNPAIPVTLRYANCYVYKYGSFSSKKGFCFIKGRYGEGVRGKLRVKYAKLDIAILLKEITPLVYFSGATSVVDLLPAINARYGFDLTVDDVVDHPVSSDGKSVKLEMAVAGTLYKGTVQLAIENALPHLEDMVVERQLDPVLSDWPIVERMNGSFLSIGHDYTEVGDRLSGYTQGVLATPTELVSLLNRVDGVPWTTIQGAAYSLADCEVLFNGSVSTAPEELSPLLRALFSNALILRVNQDANTNMSATPIVIHYNVFH